MQNNKQILINRKSLEKWFHRYYPELTFYANSTVKDLDTAKDICQKVFIKCYEKRTELEFSTENELRAYLYKAVHNTCLNQKKKEKIVAGHMEQVYYLQDISEEKVTDKIFEAELEHIIFKEIKMLPKKCKNIFQMSRFSDLSNKEIANELNISIRTVEGQISKALKILRTRLAPTLKGMKN